MPLRRVLLSVVAFLFAVNISGVHAEAGGVSYSRNRLVYNAQDNAISIAAINHGDTPYLIQSGVSGGADKMTKAPFVVMPPLFRLEGNTKNQIRILKVPAAALPADRESVFYFYSTAIPGLGENTGKNADADGKNTVGATVSFAIKTILKLFYRPSNLPVTPDQARGMLHFVQQGNAVMIKNPTPYYQSFAMLAFDGVAQDLQTHASMVAPMSHLVFPVNKRVNTVTWSVMTDLGGVTEAVSQHTEHP